MTQPPPFLNCFFEYTREAEKNELPNPKTLNPKPKVGRSQVLAALDAGSSRGHQVSGRSDLRKVQVYYSWGPEKT